MKSGSSSILTSIQQPGEYSVIGKRFPRLDAYEMVTGQARYASDVYLPNMLYGKILRSPYPHARIRSINTRQAECIPGVLGIVTAADAPHTYNFGIEIHDEPLLAWDGIVRYVGQEVAAVAAVDTETATRAIELIEVDYEKLPAVFDPTAAMQPGAPLVHPELLELKNNIGFEVSVEEGNVDAGFKEADITLEDDFVTGAAYQAYMEPDSCVANCDAGGHLTAWVGSMWPSLIRDELARTLQIPISKVRVIQDHVGGAFGGRQSLYPLHFITALLAMKTGRPVKIKLTRSEDFMLERARLPIRTHIKMGARKDGTVTAIETNVVLDNGAYQYEARRMATHMGLRSDANFRCRNVRYTCRNVYTNKVPIGTYRSFGDAEMAFPRESMIDIMAHAIGMDTAEFKMKNGPRQGDTTPHGWHLNSCGLSTCIEKAIAKAGWKEKQTRKRSGYGIGIASTCHETDDRYGDAFYGSVSFVKLLEDGRIQVMTGEADSGQGVYNAVAIAAAEEFGLQPQDIVVPKFDSNFSPWALGPLGSRVSSSAVTATQDAARKVRKRILEVAAKALQTETGSLEMKGGSVYVKGNPNKSITLADIGLAARQDREEGSVIMAKGIDERKTEYTLKTSHSSHFGASVSATYFDTTVVEVEVDTKTGEVSVLNVVVADDCGRVVDLAALEGQVQGATVQGLGAALMEELLFDQGRMVTTDFLDYRVPLMPNVPPIEKIFVETNEPGFAYGCKGGGQAAGIASIMPALANAIYDAVGVRIHSTPMTKQKILMALAQKEGNQTPLCFTNLQEGDGHGVYQEGGKVSVGAGASYRDSTGVQEAVTLIVNGESREVLVKSSETLLQVLRDKLRLTGTKEGCGTGTCGACTALLDGKAIYSCMTLAADANGKRIDTIEGLANGNILHPLQQSFIDHVAMQCGFCSPGMIMAAKAYLDEKPNPTENELKKAMAGNICRCTGYESIYQAIMAVAKGKYSLSV